MPEIQIEYDPRPLFIPFHQRTERWSCMVLHRRAGKTVACIHDLIAKALYTPKKNARYAYIAPFYRQAKDVAWSYLKEFAAPVISGRPRESELRIELLNGSWITLYGADNPDALRGIYLDGVILDEFGDMRPSLWGKVILPTLIDRGGWAVFIGTPKGKNQFYRINRRASRENGWYHILATVESTGLIPSSELEELRAQMTDEEWEQEMMCSFEAALKGAIFAKYVRQADQDGRLAPVEYDPSFPVHIAGDIGRRDATAMWHWQDRSDGIAVLDYDEKTQCGVAEFDEIFRSKPWGSGDNAGIGTLWLPHDAKAKTFATNRSAIEQFIACGYKARLVPSLSKIDGITAGRLMLRSTWFNTTSSAPTPAQMRIEEGLDSLRSYRSTYDETKSVYADSPLHDWASNGADGWRYLSIVARQGYKSRHRPEHSQLVLPGQDKYSFTLDQLHSDRDASRPRWNTHRI